MTRAGIDTDEGAIARAPATTAPTKPAVWEDDGDPGLVCDLATGTCAQPAPPRTTEDHDG